MNNTFLDAMTTVPTASTANGALAYGHTGDFVLDRFSNLNDMFETYEDVSDSLEKAWDENPLLTLRLIMYSRAISRKSALTDLEVKGLGLKNVGRLSLKWLYNNHRDVFHKNLIGIVEIGSYQDLWHKDFVADWVNAKDQNIVEFLVKKIQSNDSMALKYLPRYRSASNINRAKADSNREYKIARNKGLILIVNRIRQEVSTFGLHNLMKIKAQGKGHIFQRLISDGEFNGIDFKSLPGKVLTWISKKSPKTGDTFLKRHGLEDKYIAWLETQSTLKTTSYLYELIAPCIGSGWSGRFVNPDKVTKYTIEKQIQGLIEKAKDSNLNVMPVLDTSGSMTCTVGNTTALNVAISLATYFSMIQSGTFKDSIVAFDSTSKFKRLKGSYLTRIKDILNDSDYMGSTNFQSVINLVLDIRRKHPEIPVEDYPEAYIVISDMQFNDTSYGYSQTTNHKAAVAKLKAAGLPEPIFVWYNVSSYGNGNFQNHKNDSGVVNISGFDPAVVNRLMSGDFQLEFEEKHGKSIKEITPMEAMIETLEQDYLKLFVL